MPKRHGGVRYLLPAAPFLCKSFPRPCSASSWRSRPDCSWPARLTWVRRGIRSPWARSSP